MRPGADVTAGVRRPSRDPQRDRCDEILGPISLYCHVFSFSRETHSASRHAVITVIVAVTIITAAVVVADVVTCDPFRSTV